MDDVRLIMADLKKRYPSYNALGRVAMLRGVPLVAVIVIAFLSLIVAILGAAFSGPGGMLFGAVGIPLYLYCKKLCENDDYALRIAVLELWCWFRRLLSNAKLFGGTFTLSPMKYGRSNHVYQRYFKKPTLK